MIVEKSMATLNMLFMFLILVGLTALLVLRLPHFNDSNISIELRHSIELQREEIKDANVTIKTQREFLVNMKTENKMLESGISALRKRKDLISK